MKSSDLKQILENKIASLESIKQAYYMTGDIDNYSKIEIEIEETRETLSKIGD